MRFIFVEKSSKNTVKCSVMSVNFCGKVGELVQQFDDEFCDSARSWLDVFEEIFKPDFVKSSLQNLVQSSVSFKVVLRLVAVHDFRNRLKQMLIGSFKKGDYYRERRNLTDEIVFGDSKVGEFLKGDSQVAVIHVFDFGAGKITVLVQIDEAVELIYQV